MVKVAVYTVYRKSLHIFCLEIVCKDKTKIYFLYKMCLEKALAVIKDDDKCWFKNMAGLLSENHEKKAFTFYAPHTWAQSQAPVDPHSSLNCLKLHLQTTYSIHIICQTLQKNHFLSLLLWFTCLVPEMCWNSATKHVLCNFMVRFINITVCQSTQCESRLS